MLGHASQIQAVNVYVLHRNLMKYWQPSLELSWRHHVLCKLLWLKFRNVTQMVELVFSKKDSPSGQWKEKLL